MAAPLYDLDVTVMRQRWHDVSFLHWRYDPSVVRPLVPMGLELDLCDGAAWVGLVPFSITGLTIPHAPPIPYISNFPETNVRTYATDRTGGRGVWFFSLDAARLLAVVGARAGYALPYFWSRMRVSCDGKTARYSSERLHGPKASSSAEVTIGDRIAAPSALESFLTMRFRLYAGRAGRIWKADIEHQSWPLQHATVAALRDRLVQAAGLPAPAGEALTHYAKRVDVKVGPLVAL
jgi:uncharacterized protein YqjF (DUF2071 family)